jgi:hypothetical protein
VDDLQPIVQENLSRRTREIAHAETIVAEELLKFATWQAIAARVPTVVALRQRFGAIRRAELQRLDSKLAGRPRSRRAGVTPIISFSSNRPSSSKALRDSENAGRATEAVNRLFRLRTGESAARLYGRGGDSASRSAEIVLETLKLGRAAVSSRCFRRTPPPPFQCARQHRLRSSSSKRRGQLAEAALSEIGEASLREGNRTAAAGDIDSPCTA